MKRSIIALFLILCLTLSCTACKKDATPQVTDNAGTAGGTTSTPSTGDTLDSVTDTNSTVTITLDGTYLSVETQEDLDSVLAEKGFSSAVLNDDGTVTVTMTKEARDAYTKEIADAVTETVGFIVNDNEYYANITAVDVNSNYTEFAITTTGSELSLMDSLTSYTLLLYGEIYNIFMGVPTPEVHVVFKDTAGNDVGTLKDALELAKELFGSIFSGGGEPVVFEEVDYPETVLVDSDAIKVTVKSIDANGDWGYTVNMEVLNKTDKCINVSTDYSSVNDWAFSTMCGIDVEAGATGELEMSFDSYSLGALGITDIFAIEFLLNAHETSSWDDYNFDDVDDDDYWSVGSNVLYEGLQVIYPHGAENSTIPPYTIPEDACILTDTDDYRVLVTESYFDDTWDSYTFRIYIENKSDLNLTFELNDIYANNWKINNYLYENVPAHKRATDTVSVYSELLDEIGESEPTAINLKLSTVCYDPDYWVLGEEYLIFFPRGYDYYEQNPVPLNTERPIGEGETLLEDNEYYSIVVTGFEESDWGGYNMDLVFTNKSYETLDIHSESFEGILLNGEDAMCSFSEVLDPCTSSVATIYLNNYSENPAGAETVDMKVWISNLDDYEDFFERNLTYNVK